MTRETLRQEHFVFDGEVAVLRPRWYLHDASLFADTGNHRSCGIDMGQRSGPHKLLTFCTRAIFDEPSGELAN
jgi:hypothetical protein